MPLSATCSRGRAGGRANAAVQVPSAGAEAAAALGAESEAARLRGTQGAAKAEAMDGWRRQMALLPILCSARQGNNTHQWWRNLNGESVRLKVGYIQWGADACADRGGAAAVTGMLRLSLQ